MGIDVPADEPDRKVAACAVDYYCVASNGAGQSQINRPRLTAY
ncbi:MAG: hypothetical protein HW390_2228 [Candidatus Brocadiaceae bacterium]|nr:hypothetical protein [Candidatus Brocadiaceae bacterium]